MANTVYAAISDATSFPKRILANLQAQVSWEDAKSGRRISILGITENIGEASALVNIDVLPEVGTSVNLRLLDDDNTIVETMTEVIRVERDPGKPLVALSVARNFGIWKEKAMEAAQAWVTKNLKLNYEEEWAN